MIFIKAGINHKSLLYWLDTALQRIRYIGVPYVTRFPSGNCELIIDGTRWRMPIRKIPIYSGPFLRVNSN